MDYKDIRHETLQGKYADWLNEAKGGIFTRRAREMMMGLRRLPIKGQPRNDFWYRNRLYVASALKDISIFAQAAGPENVEQVITLDSLKPVFNSIIWSDITGPEGDIVYHEKAEIAQYMVELGLSYLERINPIYISRLASRVIGEAIEISRYLTAISLPEEERGKFDTWLENGVPSEQSQDEEEDKE